MKTKLLAFLLVFFLCTLTLSACACKHEWNEATCSVPQTCSKCGETQGTIIEHTWEDATCTKSKTCSVCGETEGIANGHVVRLGTCPICSEKATELLSEAKSIVSSANDIINYVGYSMEFIRDSYSFSTDTYQKEYVSKARERLYNSRYPAEYAIKQCSNYEEFSTAKNKLQKIVDLITDEKIIGTGNYKEIRSSIIEAIDEILPLLQSILDEATNWYD